MLNNHPQVDPRLAATVRAAVAELGYRPSRVARSLRTRRSRVWALLISDIRNPFFTDMVRGVEDVAYAAGYSLILCNNEEDAAKEASYIELAIAENTAGVILTPTSVGTSVAPLLEARIPVVVADRGLAADVDSVTIDNVAGAEQAVRHLLGGGYRRIGGIIGPTRTSTGADRYAGYCRAIESSGLSLDESLVRFADFREAGGRAAMEELLALAEPPDAVFAANNLMSIGALHAIAAAGLAIPDQIAMVGFDDMSWVTLLRPPLTTVAQPTYDLGAETARLLQSRIDGYSGAARRVTLAPTLRIRGSSAPSRGGAAASKDGLRRGAVGARARRADR